MATSVLKQNQNISETWEINKSDIPSFTENDVIDAYLQGKESGLNSYKKTLISALKEKVEKSGKLTKTILDIIKSNDFSYSDAFLKIENFTMFNVLICVQESDFLKERFLELYGSIMKIEDEHNDSSYNIEFSFLDYTTDYCKKTLKSDGYLFKFKKD